MDYCVLIILFVDDIVLKGQKTVRYIVKPEVQCPSQNDFCPSWHMGNREKYRSLSFYFHHNERKAEIYHFNFTFSKYMK